MKNALFVDMDGTLAKFYEQSNCLDKMWEKGFFRNLKPYQLVKTIKQIQAMDLCDVYILSACIDSVYCEEEKRAWLHEHLPDLADDHMIFLMVGESKSRAVFNRGNKEVYNNMVLLDDYNPNLDDWTEHQMGTAIKFCNGINNKSHEWQGLKVKTNKQLIQLLQNI